MTNPTNTPLDAVPNMDGEIREQIRSLIAQTHARYTTAKKVGADAERHTQIGVSVEQHNFDDYLPQDEAVEAIMQLHEAAIRETDWNARLAMGNRLNKAIFFSSTEPKGQFVKNCILDELDAVEAERIDQLKSLEGNQV